VLEKTILRLKTFYGTAVTQSA